MVDPEVHGDEELSAEQLGSVAGGTLNLGSVVPYEGRDVSSGGPA